MKECLAKRMRNVNPSFVREILKVTEKPEIISFAGGLPNPKSFPIKEINQAAQKVLTSDGASALQYSTTQGDIGLREFIAERYRTKHGLDVSAKNILITNGSQQGLDLISKIFLNPGDPVVIERPGYLGAIQAMSMFEATFRSVSLENEGVDLSEFKEAIADYLPKFFYAVTNFNNPTGITYSAERKQQIANCLQKTNIFFVEDNPYGELRFFGEDVPLMYSYLPKQTILLGSFSKTISPGLRLGWVCADEEIIGKLVIAEQVASLHTNSFAQKVILQYLQDNDLDEHIAKIQNMYQQKRDLMVAELEKYFPKEVEFTRPEGGMFLWVTLPKGISAVEVFQEAIKQNIAFVPGDPFYVDKNGVSTLRLNYTNSSDEQIQRGVRAITKAIKKFLRECKINCVSDNSR